MHAAGESVSKSRGSQQIGASGNGRATERCKDSESDTETPRLCADESHAREILVSTAKGSDNYDPHADLSD